LIIEQGDCTLGKNLNNAIQKSQGEFIKVLAEDDELTPNCLQILMDGIEGYDFVYSDAENFGILPPGWDKRSHDTTVTLESMLKGNGIHGGSTLYRKKALIYVGCYDEYLWTGEEYDLHLKLIKAGFRHRHIPGIVYRYRIHIANKSISATGTERKARHEYIDKIRQRYV
jgi:GT2 family glycosyltransferase